MDRTFTNRQGEKPCFICGETVADGEESTWDRSPKRQGSAISPAFAARNLTERNGNGGEAATLRLRLRLRPKSRRSLAVIFSRD